MGMDDPDFCVEMVYTGEHHRVRKYTRRGNMRFTEQLRQQAAAVRERVFHHPFVTGIGDGTLPLMAFRYYMCQDYVFLIDYCRSFAAQFGISTAELEATQAAPSTRSYTQHLLATAYTGSLTEITTALLPCMWDYSDIGERLAAQGAPASQPLYGEWIRMYAAPEFGELATWLRDLLDRLATHASAAEQTRLMRLFVDSCRYEYLFWDMAYRQETWPV